MSYDPYKALEAYIEREYFDDALRMVNQIDDEILKRLRFLGISEVERYTLMSRRTAAEKLRNIIKTKIVQSKFRKRREQEQRERERSERIAKKRLTASAETEYHIDPEILAMAEANEYNQEEMYQ